MPSSEYEEEIEKRIKKESKGSFREVFEAIFSDNREHGKSVDHERAQNDAEVINDFIFSKLNTVNYLSHQDLIDAHDEDDKEEAKAKFKMILLHIIEHRHANQV